MPKPEVVPARAGMSPTARLTTVNLTSGPRASGDEPVQISRALVERLWSPRERG